TLGGATNDYAGGTFVNAGRLALGSGTAIPAGGNVTVAAGATFDTGGLANTPATAIGTVTLNGGTLQIPGALYSPFYINKLVTDANGGTVDATGSPGVTGLVFANAGAGITINGNSTWTGPREFYVVNFSGAELPIAI